MLPAEKPAMDTPFVSWNKSNEWNNSISKRSFATLSTQDDNGNNNGDDDGDDDFRPPRWLRKLQRKAASNAPMDSQKAYQYLGLEKFSEDELKERFRAILESGKPRELVEAIHGVEEPEELVLNRTQLHEYMLESIQQQEQHAEQAASSSNNSSNSNNNESSEPSPTSSIDDSSVHIIDRLRTEYVEAETQQLWSFLTPNNSTSTSTSTSTSGGNDGDDNAKALTESQFVERLTAAATALDKQRLSPLTLSMVMIGLSVGVTTPAFPFVVQNLGLTTGEYGMVISAFALTKLMGNIPFAVLVERNGRKPYLVYSLIAISTGVGCIGLAGGFEELYACRLMTGLGVAALSCAATMAVTDISTPLNRASSFAPISAGFAAGTAMGPALGGILIDELGVNPTFYLVGGSFLMLGGINSVLLDETMKKPNTGFPWQEKVVVRKQKNGETSENSPSTGGSDSDSNTDNNDSIQKAFKSALGQWVPLLSEAPIRNVCIINAFYWVALAGGQMTLLPLLLTDPSGLAMTATQVGQVYMGMSFVQVLGNPVFARVVDTVGTVPGIVGGCTMITTAMYTMPSCAVSPSDNLQMAAVLGLWAAGSTLLSTSPIAHIGNTVDDSKRAQAIALLRTAGDVGFLVGASSMGMVSDWAGSLETAMQSSAAILGTATSWYVARNIMTSKLL